MGGVLLIYTALKDVVFARKVDAGEEKKSRVYSFLWQALTGKEHAGRLFLQVDSL